MTCSTRFRRLLQASCLGLIGTLTVVGCGGSDTNNPKKDSGPTQGDVPPAAGTVRLDQVALLFGNVDVGTPSAPKTVTATVTGAPVALNATVIGDGFAISENLCKPMQPVGTCTISVVFAPTRVGAANGSLTVGAATVSLSGTGTQPGVFVASPESFPLGTMLVGASAPVAFDIIPNGTVPSVTCLPSGADITLATTTCPTAGAPVSAKCSYTFTFKATSAGDKAASIVCNGGGTTRTVSVTAKVVTPAVLAVNPPTQAFIANVGQAVTWTFNVSNAGGAQTGNLSAAASGAGFAISSNDCPPQLAGFGVCKIQVTFAPTAVGAVTGALTVTDATPGTTPGTAVLSGNGIDSKVTITPATKDFLTVVVGQTSSAAFTMVNTGTAATGIVDLASTDGQFVLGADLCSGSALEAKAQCTFSVTFAPASAGLKQAMINATSGGKTLASLPLTGTGQAAPKPAHLTMSPPFLDFGTTGVQVPVGPKVFTITNDGEVATAALQVLKNVSTSESAASQFSYTSPDCAGVTLPAKGTCHVAVTFAPTIAGSASAVIIVTDGAASTASMTGGTTPNGTVTGIALGIPLLTVGCTPVDADATDVTPFDPTGTVVGDTEKVVCTVMNNEQTSGNTPQESGIITINPVSDTPATGTFAVGTNNCTASLQPNTSCIFELVFSPLGRGITKGTVSISSTNRGANNQRISALGLLPVEIEEWVLTGATLGKKAVTNYDFGQVPQGGSSADDPLKTVISLRVFVRKQVGNLAISGSDLSWKGDAALSDFTLTPAATDGCKKIDSAVALKTDAKATPYCTATIAFTPQVKTAVTTTIKALGGDGTSDSAALSGTGTGPLSIQPSPVTFDAVAAGSASIEPLTLTVCNHTTSSTQQAVMTITGTNAAAFAVVLDPVTNKDFHVGGTPADGCVYPTLRLAVPAGTAAGPLSAKITVTAVIAGVTETQTVDLVGSVVNGAALTVTASGPFADTAMTNHSAPVVYTVKNTGALRTDELYFDIPDQQITTSIYGDFFLQPSLHSELTLAQGTCAPNASGVGVRLNPDQTCTLNVWFMPNPELGAVQRNSVLVVSSPIGGRQVVPLTGKATPQLVISQGATSPVPSVTVDPTAFGRTDGPTTDITLTNLGGVDVAVSDLNFAFVDGVGQTGSGLFRRLLKSGTTCTTIGKAGSQSPPDHCIYTLRMIDNESPSVPGARSTTLEITNTANGTQKATVVVNGTAVAPPSLAFTAASLVDRSFGPVVYGTSSRTLTFTLTNTGGMKADTITTRDVYVLDTDGATKAWSQSTYGKAGDFVLSGCEPNTDASRLEPAASCVISVTFHPTQCTSGAGCKTTPATLPANTHLVVIYPVNGTATTVNGANLAGSAIDATAVPYIVDATAGLAPYDFGLVTTTSAKITLSVKNETADDFNVPAVADQVITGVVASTGLVLADIEDEFAVTSGGATGDCEADGSTTLEGGMNQSCKLILTWTPTTTPGTREVNVKLGATGPSIDIIGRVPTMPKLVAISPLGTSAHPLDFGNAVINVASAAIMVTIQNQGERATDGDLNVVGASGISGTDAVSATGCESQLAAGATCVLTAKVTPAAATARTSIAAVRIQLAKDDTDVLAFDPVNTTVQALYATWTGKTAAKITRSPTDAKLDFDTPSTSGYGTPVLAGETAYTTVDVTLSNTATTAVKTGPMTFQTDNDDYSIDLDTANSTCLLSTYAFDGLIAGGSCVVRVIFSPTAQMATPPSTGNLIIKSANAATVTVPLTGTPIPSLSVTATAASGNTFTAATATASAKLVFKTTSVVDVANYPEQEFTFSKAAGSPPTGLLSTLIDSDQFKIISDECIGIALQEAIPGHTDFVTSCKIKVRFAPTSSSSTAKTATLTVTDPTSGTPADAAAVSLSGMANP